MGQKAQYKKEGLEILRGGQEILSKGLELLKGSLEILREIVTYFNKWEESIIF